MSLANLGIVAIGRNEGERLRQCLHSLTDFAGPLVYVDSGSTDDSVSLAESMEVAVWKLDPSQLMSAARARREGFRQLAAEHPDLEFVFFVDGDWQVASKWLPTAIQFLHEHEDVAAVCGRRRERHPERSVYNRLCDVEWDSPIGAAKSVGGDAVYRCAAYREAGEFDPTVTAGEEPELCKRLRDRGWKIWRLDAKMTVHDAAMTNWGQWWRRQFRTGYAGHDVEQRFQLGIFNRIIKSAYVWGLGVPLFAAVTALVLGWLISPWWAVGALGIALASFALQSLRIAWRTKTPCYTWRQCLELGVFTMAAKFPIAFGAMRQTKESRLGKQAQLVEYKTRESLKPQ